MKAETEALRRLAEILPELTSGNLVRWTRHEDGSLQADLSLRLENIHGKSVRLEMRRNGSGKAAAETGGPEIEQLFLEQFKDAAPSYPPGMAGNPRKR